MAKRQLLGELLVADGAITRAQLDAALATQKKLKGRLGSNLVELGFIELGVLAEALSKQFGVPAAQRTDFVLLDKALAQKLPARASELYKAVPLGVSPTNPSAIRVAIADPSNIVALDELAGIMGSKIEPLVAPEMRILQLQQRIYGLKPVRKTLLREGIQQAAVSRVGKIVGSGPPQPKGTAPKGRPPSTEAKAERAAHDKQPEATDERSRALHQLLRGRRAAAPGLQNTVPTEVVQRDTPQGASPPNAHARRRKTTSTDTEHPHAGAQQKKAQDQSARPPHDAPQPRLERAGVELGRLQPRQVSPTAGKGSAQKTPTLEARDTLVGSAAAADSSAHTNPATLVSARSAVEAPPSRAAFSLARDNAKDQGAAEPLWSAASARQATRRSTGDPPGHRRTSEKESLRPPHGRRLPATEHIVLPKSFRLPSEAATRTSTPELVGFSEDDASALLAKIPVSPRLPSESRHDRRAAAPHSTAARIAEALPGDWVVSAAAAESPESSDPLPTERNPMLSTTQGPLSRPLLVSAGVDSRRGRSSERRPQTPGCGSDSIPELPPHELLKRTIDALGYATSKDDVASAIADYVSRAYGAGLLLVVKGDIALGWKGCSKSLAPAVVEATMLPLACSSVFQTVVRTSRTYRGAVPAEGALIVERLWKVLNAGKPEEILVAPVVIKSRVVNLLYAQSIPGRAMPLTAEADISQLTAAAALAFQNVILKRST